MVVVSELERVVPGGDIECFVIAGVDIKGLLEGDRTEVEVELRNGGCQVLLCG
jgi:hypothetical protein